MNELVQAHKEELDHLCHKHHIESLCLFGSAVTGHLTAESDLDFFVRFSVDLPLLDFADNYFLLKHALEQLFDRPVDLVTEASVTNSVLKSEIDRTKVLLYAA